VKKLQKSPGLAPLANLIRNFLVKFTIFYLSRTILWQWKKYYIKGPSLQKVRKFTKKSRLAPLDGTIRSF
jgi:hypothetical protein